MNRKTEKPDERIPRLALKPAEAADALGISARTLWSLTKAGRVPYVQEGRTILYPVDVLREWLSERAKTPAVESPDGKLAN